MVCYWPAVKKYTGSRLRFMGPFRSPGHHRNGHYTQDTDTGPWESRGPVALLNRWWCPSTSTPALYWALDLPEVLGPLSVLFPRCLHPIIGAVFQIQTKPQLSSGVFQRKGRVLLTHLLPGPPSPLLCPVPTLFSKQPKAVTSIRHYSLGRTYGGGTQ